PLGSATGIPKFYRWLSERYPLLNQKVTATEGPPEIDNLYLDMNGIIHNCTHANQREVKLGEDDMMLRIFDYIDKLIQIIKPQKLLFMAIDGCAPRAKMNQQRSRRFKSAKEAEEARLERERKGEPLPEHSFDSNCITPGTPFMDRLGKHLRFFIRRKMSEDPLWQAPTIIFSGHDVPGEGEHKIMEFIRWEKRSPDFAPNQRHCLYGLDADLIMLSLVTHEPHFCLLREVVSYTGGNRGQPAREALENPSAENFVLFHISLLREYLELEFKNVVLPFPLDVERIVDDFVLFCMLIGNDFLPGKWQQAGSRQHADCRQQAGCRPIAAVCSAVVADGEKVKGGRPLHGELDRRRLEVLLVRLGALEQAVLEERAKVPCPVASSPLLGALEGDAEGEEEAALPLPSAEPTMMSREARQLMLGGQGARGLQLWKERWYTEKLGARSPEERRAVVDSYLQGLHWVLEYYYRGVASWNWYYPYYFAPMASDMVQLDTVEVSFTQGTAFRPYEQLLGVLPAASCALLPGPYQHLMTNPASPIIDFYPTQFEIDSEGKRAAWEGVVKVPFVDEERLLAAARSVGPSQLSSDELARNELGGILVFTALDDSQEKEFCKTTMAQVFSDVIHPKSKLVTRPMPPPLPVGDRGFEPLICPGTTTGLYAPHGYPSLKSLTVRPELRMAGINVLGTASRKESLLLGLRDLRAALGGRTINTGDV
ncbi:hypothetical protein QJQ45_015162, partial [Haematococcus lacustris]